MDYGITPCLNIVRPGVCFRQLDLGLHVSLLVYIHTIVFLWSNNDQFLWAVSWYTVCIIHLAEDPDEANRLRFGGILQRQNQKVSHTQLV